jgi:hypothetical protein
MAHRKGATYMILTSERDKNKKQAAIIIPDRVAWLKMKIKKFNYYHRKKDYPSQLFSLTYR